MNTERIEHRTRGVWPDWLMMGAIVGGCFISGLVGHIDGRRQAAAEHEQRQDDYNRGRTDEREALQEAIDQGWSLRDEQGREIQDVTR